MGGDHGPPVVIPAALNALSETAGLRLVDREEAGVSPGAASDVL